ncbi:hypothetical protein Tco_1070481 [Tanacetum coccineum]|uniref:Uncharacterized protein n=1 Tax=Tanacetum coccineum TaxID=301880 RepID=A0ABQ5HLT7_9ASTR
MSATEAECIAASEAAMEADWIRRMCLPNSQDIQKMNIGLPQLTRLSLYGSASLSEPFILNKVATKDYFRNDCETYYLTLVVNKEFVPSIVEE